MPATAKLNLPIPPILLEGDQPVAPPPGVSPRLASTPAPPTTAAPPGEGNLPEAYGTGRLFLTPRDPHCLCAHWDLTGEQLREYNARAAGQHLALRVYLETVGGEPAAELNVHPESRHWFVHVARPGVRYAAELGYYTAAKQWHSIASSDPVATPADAPPARQETPRFATFELETRPQPPGAPPMVAASPNIARENRPGIAGPERLPVGGAPVRPGSRPAPRKKTYPLSREASGELMPGAEPVPQAKGAEAVPAEAEQWSPAAEEALWEIIACAPRREEWPGSAEIAELARRRPEHAVLAPEAAEAARPPGLPELGVSSPTGGEVVPAKVFWLSVNAELIVYGATDPSAQVSIGGKPIRLQPDGTFSYRFALPDGTYSLPVVAVASHGEVRRADLVFSCHSNYEGEVAAHAQSPQLKPPAAQNVT